VAVAEIEQKDVIANVRTNLDEVFRKIAEEMKKIDMMSEKDVKRLPPRERFIKDRDRYLRLEARLMQEILGVLYKHDKSLFSQVDWLRIMYEIRERLLTLSGKDYAILERTVSIFEEIVKHLGAASYEAERFAKQLIYSTGPVKEGLPWYMRISRTISSMAEGTHRLTAASRVYVTQTGEVVAKQTLSASLLQSLAGGLQNMIRSLTRGLTLWAAIGVALYEIVQRSIKFNGELRTIQAAMGLIDERFRLGNTYLAQWAKVTESITRWTGRTMGEVMEWVENIRYSGILLGALGKNLDYVYHTATALEAVQRAFNVNLSEAASIIQRLQLSYGMIGEAAVSLGRSGEMIVSQATKFYLGLVNAAAPLAKLGIQTSKVVSDMGELVGLADEYDLSVRDVTTYYLSLLALKKEDVERSGALRDVSLETLRNFTQMAVKAAGMSLSWKVMVATLAGARFTNIVDLERRFMNVGEAAGMIQRAAMFPFRVGVLMQMSPQWQRAFGEQLRKGDEHAMATLRALYSLYSPLLENVGINFEMFRALTISNLTGRELTQAQKEQLKRIEEQMRYAERPVLLGMDILTETKGISGYLNKLLGWVIKGVIYLAKLAGVGDVAGKIEEGMEETVRRMEEAPRVGGIIDRMSAVYLEDLIEKIESVEGYMSDMEVLWEGWSEQQRAEWMRARRKELEEMVRETERITGAKIEMKMEAVVDPQSLKGMLEEIQRELEKKMRAVLTRATATAERTL
jgi:hypothetical protein